jgi:putative ABC transport system permease protein
MLAAISVRNLYLQRRRYTLILVAITLGFALVILMSGVSRSLQNGLKDKASRYFAGHVGIVGYHGATAGLSDPGKVIAAVRSTGIAVRAIAGRSVYYRTDAELFFGGESVRQRRLIGVDFGAEGGEFSRLSYASGGWEEMENGGGILISESAARRTGARVGDDMTVFATADSGQYGALVFVVRGIFQESSLFGYVSYLSLADMNSLQGKKAGYNSEVAVFLKNPGRETAAANAIRRRLAGEFRVFPRYETKDELYTHLGESAEHETIAVMGLEGYIAQIRQLLQAIITITYFVLAVFILIVAVAIMNTYRVIVNERTREIGTMRALGMSRPAVAVLFVVEAVTLVAVGSTIGFAVGAGFMGIVSAIDLGALPGAGLFMEARRLRYVVDQRAALVSFAVMLLVTLIAVSGPVRRASRIAPSEALREE